MQELLIEGANQLMQAALRATQETTSTQVMLLPDPSEIAGAETGDEGAVVQE